MISEASDYFSKANSLFVDGSYEEALEQYNEAIELDGSNAEYLVKRAACHTQLENFTEAIDDANAAISLSPNNVGAFRNKGIALFSLDEFESAKSVFEQGLSIAPDDKQLKTWLRKANAELGITTTTTTTTTTAAPAPATTTTTTTQPDTAQTVPQAATSTPTPTPTPLPKVRHEFYQNTQYVVLSIFIKGVKKEATDIDLSSKSVSVTIKQSESNEYHFTFDLFDEIVPSGCKIEYLSTKIEIKLKKKVERDWDAFEATDTPLAPAPSITPSVSSEPSRPSYPSSSKKKINWDAIDAEIAKEMESEKPEGDAALNQLFQQIYAQGSDETKRAMMKSFVESGGTVLSTNWDEVGKGKVKGTPPKGMEMHEWGKE